jgi:preprotein translocase subunit SecG
MLRGESRALTACAEGAARRAKLIVGCKSAMIILLTVIHVLVCFFLIVVVLLQSGKAADLAGAFGGMGSQTAFGPRGAATVLSKATTVAAALFMITSLSLSVVATRSQGGGATVLDSVKTTPISDQKGAPAAPAPTQAPTMTLHPEGDPSKAVTVPLPLPDQKGGAKVSIPLPGQGGGAQGGSADVPPGSVPLPMPGPMPKGGKPVETKAK